MLSLYLSHRLSTFIYLFIDLTPTIYTMLSKSNAYFVISQGCYYVSYPSHTKITVLAWGITCIALPCLVGSKNRSDTTFYHFAAVNNLYFAINQLYPSLSLCPYFPLSSYPSLALCLSVSLSPCLTLLLYLFTCLPCLPIFYVEVGDR